MPSKYEKISELAVLTAADLSSGAGRYMEFLVTAANNYKYTFKEQLLIHAQKPTATACAEINVWNRLGRWVNKGTKGIALLVDTDSPYKLRHVFDISDTNSRHGHEVALWQFRERYADSVIEALENSFGPLDEHSSFAEDLIQITDAIVEDNAGDYLDMLRPATVDSLLEELDDLNLEVWLKNTVKSSVAFMTLTRCGYDASRYIPAEDFARAYDFNTLETISVLGEASSDMAEMALREIESTVRALEKAEKKQNRTFANARHVGDNVRKTNERSVDNGTDIPTGGRLSAAQPDRAGESEGREIWNAAARFPAPPPQSDLHSNAAGREAELPLGGDRPGSDRDDGTSDERDGTERGRDGGAESVGSDAVGTADEQHRAESRGVRADGADLQLNDDVAETEAPSSVLQPSGHDFNQPTEIPYYHRDAEKQELLRTCDALKEHTMLSPVVS